MLNHDEPIFRVLERDDQQPADNPENKHMPFHGGVAKKFNGAAVELPLRHDVGSHPAM
jgi:hypothetical protein